MFIQRGLNNPKTSFKSTTVCGLAKFEHEIISTLEPRIERKGAKTVKHLSTTATTVNRTELINNIPTNRISSGLVSGGTPLSPTPFRMLMCALDRHSKNLRRGQKPSSPCNERPVNSVQVEDSTTSWHRHSLPFCPSSRKDNYSPPSPHFARQMRYLSYSSPNLVSYGLQQFCPIPFYPTPTVPHHTLHC